MTKSDVIFASRDVLDFLKINNNPISFNQGDFFVYICWANKFINIHDAKKSRKAPKNKISTTSNILIDETKNGAWIGPFASFSDALTFTVLFKRAILFKTHEDMTMSFVGLDNNPYKLF